MSKQKTRETEAPPRQDNTVVGYASDAPRHLLSGERIEPGEVVSDRYELGEAIASAPRHLVCMANDKESGRKVVLKICRGSQDVVGSPATGLRNESRVAGHAGLHPNVLTYYSLDSLRSVRGDALLALVTEAAPDGSLRNHFHQNGGSGTTSTKDAFAAIREVCAGLSHLHDKGILHLDLKPENILLFGRTAKLADFESSVILCSKDIPSADDYGEGLAIRQGTLAYMAPERFVVRHVAELGPTADIYSLGIMLYELADSTGRPPWTGSTQYIRDAHLRKDPLNNSSMGPATARIISRCLQKDPGQRYQSINELLPDLDAIEQEVVGTNEPCADDHEPCAEARAEADAIYRELNQSMRAGDIEEMLELLDEAESICPSHPEGRLTSLRLGRRVRAFSGSIDSCAEALASGDLPEALQHAKAATDIYPESVPAKKLVEYLEPRVVEADLLRALEERDFDRALKCAEALDDLEYSLPALPPPGVKS